MNKAQNRFAFFVRYIQAISLFFALFGLYWAVSGTFDPFGLYEKALALNFWQNDTLPEDAAVTFRFLLGPLGATCAGYFLMQFFIGTFAYAKREKWGYFAVVVPFFVWLLTDSLICILIGAYFNVYIVNIPCLIAMLPVIGSYRYFR
jgi:hypothetical protein